MLDLDYTRRHIIFNGESDSEHDLAMMGNTPLLIPSPKKSSIEVPFTDGNIDTSEIGGTLYFEKHTIQYSFICNLMKNSSTTEEMNQRCFDKIEEIKNWLYSGPATLTDYGLLRNLSDADCKGISVSKSVSPTQWILRFDVTFTAPFNVPTYYPAKTQFNRNGRFFVYNGAATYNFGLMMVGATPVSAESPKSKELTWTNRDGSLDLSHGKNGLTTGRDSQFYSNYSIGYRLFKDFPLFNSLGQRYNPCEMNQHLQEFVEEFCNWVYRHSTQPFTTIDGQITYGGTDLMLMDSAWINGSIPSSGSVSCDFLPSARVASLNINKAVHSDRWSLTFVIRFEAFPKFFTGYLALPTELEPSPSITVPVWKHYAETPTSERNDTIYLLQFEPSHEFLMGAGIFATYGAVDASHSCVWVEHGTALTNQAYDVYGPYITAKLDISLEEFYHPSIKDLEDKYVMAVSIPPFITITCGDRTMTYLCYLNGFTVGTGTARTQFMMRTFHGYFAHTDYTSSYPGVIFADVFNATVEIKLYAAGTEGLGSEYFTAEEMQTYNQSLEIPLTLHYIQKIGQDDVISEYGLWGEYSEYVPEECRLKWLDIFDYEGTEHDEGYFDFVPYNVAEEGDVTKFEPPIVHVSFPQQISSLQIPIVNETGNNYIWCDSPKPEGGDIQWL